MGEGERWKECGGGGEMERQRVRERERESERESRGRRIKSGQSGGGGEQTGKMATTAKEGNPTKNSLSPPHRMK